MPLDQAAGEGFGYRIDLGIGESLSQSFQCWKHLDHIPEGAEAHHQNRPGR